MRELTIDLDNQQAVITALLKLADMVDHVLLIDYLRARHGIDRMCAELNFSIAWACAYDARFGERPWDHPQTQPEQERQT